MEARLSQFQRSSRERSVVFWWTNRRIRVFCGRLEADLSAEYDGFHRKITENPLLSAGFLLRLPQLMKRAFVIRLSPDSNPLESKFQGHVEEVDTGRELKFRSLEEFLAFLQKCVADGSGSE